MRFHSSWSIQENLAWIDLSFNDLTSIDPVSPIRQA